ncbi:MAG: LysR family transcriptional regulator [Methylobacteriaceae bacterium]|jgi:DNA-binding transcriptional LysR family regulator|nr:LysR family transcriptional regulator [Methylobacteriaceae bacterium]
MDLEWLEDFAALADAENFTRAAALRHVTQPAFSRRIHALEQFLGAQLFIRGRRKVVLTRAGEEIRGEAEAISRAVSRLRRVAKEHGVREAATLNFAATHSLSFSFFPGWIKQYTHFFGRSPINLISDTMAACEAALVQGQVQFLLCHDSSAAPSRFRDKGFESRVVGTDTLSPFSAPDAGGGPMWTLDGFPDEPVRWLRYSSESGFNRMMSAHQGIAACMAAVPPVFTSRLATVLLSVACQGQGIAWLPASLAATAVAQKLLVPAGGAEWQIPMVVRLFLRRDERSDAALTLWREIDKINTETTGANP